VKKNKKNKKIKSNKRKILWGLKREKMGVDKVFEKAKMFYE
jgi:hypothetical protein